MLPYKVSPECAILTTILPRTHLYNGSDHTLLSMINANGLMETNNLTLQHIKDQQTQENKTECTLSLVFLLQTKIIVIKKNPTTYTGCATITKE